MQVRELIKALDHWDKAGIWAFSSATLGLVFNEDVRTLLKSLARHQRLGLITRVARGLYINPRARSLPPDVLSALVPFIRPWDFNYLSLESALSEAGWISQIPSRMTLMSTGRSQTFNTPYGTLEFVHTARNPESFADELNYDGQREMAVATPDRALRDLKRVGRNLDLVASMESSNAATHAH
ncbi:type IV toxin-antitoxin system AbiEi family antitoxin [Ralstonia sp. ASV6]|uniref:type IV toxin-antitoxin system AbiEi family antitoxin n=1 Tax=Ralstonia sp. ASV6 TaxID=2795124 RepID=UPI0018EE0FD7|nr:hypothetical protein [Ralstonia sp. ASV6]